jgi:hypothetical protein
MQELTIIRSRVTATNKRVPLPLFEWADDRQDEYCPRTHYCAASIVARRFGLPPWRARLIAGLAGLRLEASQNA